MARLIVALMVVAAPVAQAQQRSDTLPVRIAERQIEAFNARDLETFLGFYADDAVAAEFPSGKVILQGKAAIRAGFTPLFSGPNRLVVKVEPRIVQGSFVADRETWPGPPDQRNSAVWMYEITGGLIRRFWRVSLP